MTKRDMIKALKEIFEVNKVYFKKHDIEVKHNSKTYHIKVMSMSGNHQITVNSKHYWNIKKGKINGIKFNTTHSELLNLEEFNKLKNKIIFLTNKPFKLLKALNESDLKDISEEVLINDIFVTSDADLLKKYIENDF